MKFLKKVKWTFISIAILVIGVLVISNIQWCIRESKWKEGVRVSFDEVKLPEIRDVSNLTEEERNALMREGN